jgi:hypothetical protein
MTVGVSGMLLNTRYLKSGDFNLDFQRNTTLQKPIRFLCGADRLYCFDNKVNGVFSY